MTPNAACHWLICGVSALVFITSAVNLDGAEIVAGPGDGGLRSAIAAAHDGDTVILTNVVEIEAPIRLTNRITLRSNRSDSWYIFVSGKFAGPLFEVAKNDVIFEWLRFYGSLQTDGFGFGANMILRDCVVSNVRRPFAVNWDSQPNHLLTLERVLFAQCHETLEVPRLIAKDSTFSEMAGYDAVSPRQGDFLRCKFERNSGVGLQMTYGSIKDCVFRFNGGFGLRYDPDPGVLNISGSLFYANAGGGAYLGEQAIVTVDNCTFTRHTESPALIVDQADGVLLRHCTVVDNLLINPGSSPWYPWTAAVSLGFSSPVELQNCLIAENPTSEDPDADGISGFWVDRGGNVIGGNAGLGVLRDNGGPTFTMLPLPGSPALDAAVASELVTDARGLSRVAGAAPDAGAVEAQAAPIVDSDDDGVPDLWETFHALNPADSSDAVQDNDGDGLNALAEFKAGTDPNSSVSVMRIEEFRLNENYDGSGTRLATFKWRPISGATYRVETSNDLLQWRTATGFTQMEVIQPDIRALQFTAVEECPTAFYRLVVVENARD